MDGAFSCFPPFNHGFLIRRASEMAKAKAIALIIKLVKKQQVDEETNAEHWPPSTKRCEMNRWYDYISHDIDVSKELHPDFNLPKIHLMSHWVEQLPQYGALQQYSAERHEDAHQKNLNDGWNASNHNLGCLLQGLTFLRCIRYFKIRELNLQAIAQCSENGTATCKVLPSGSDLAAHLSFQSYAKAECMGPQNRRNDKPPDTIIKDFEALLDNTQEATHRVTIF
jgi:hypothetical protein